MINSIINKEILDIYTVGFALLEDEEILDYCVDFEYLYIEFDNFLLKFQVDIKTNFFSIEKVNKINYSLHTDEDIIKVKSSIINIVLIDCMLKNNIVKNIEYNYIKNNIYKNIKIILENNQTIFIDSGFLDGLRIGGKEQELYSKYCDDLL